MQWLHVVTANPASLYSMPALGNSVQCLDLSSFLPFTHRWNKPQLNLVCLRGVHEGKVLLHEAAVSDSVCGVCGVCTCTCMCVYAHVWCLCVCVVHACVGVWKGVLQ